MGLTELLKKRNRKLLFTTPSHGQKFFIFSKFRQFYKYDISETDAYNPQEALKKAQKYAAKIYGTNYTYFLTNGSTSGVIAAVLACTVPDDKVLIWDNAHICHSNAVKLAGCEPVFYSVDEDKNWGIPFAVTADVIEERLKKDKIKAVVITSPTYEGNIADVGKIKSVCETYGAYLIADEAHGAIYPFSEKLPESAVKIADFTVQSLHKTAGGLNPTALLHSCCKIDPENALKMINTTSPSYPLLASVEKNIRYLNSSKCRKKIDELVENINLLKKECGLSNFGGSDPLKILVKVPDLKGHELSQILYEKYNIEDEKTNEVSTMLLCGIGTDLKKTERLKRALKKILSKHKCEV